MAAAISPFVTALVLSPGQYQLTNAAQEHEGTYEVYLWTCKHSTGACTSESYYADATTAAKTSLDWAVWTGTRIGRTRNGHNNGESLVLKGSQWHAVRRDCWKPGRTAA